MKKQDDPRPLAAQLLKQEPLLESAEHRAFQDQLESRLAAATREERSMRRILFAALAIAGLYYGIIYVILAHYPVSIPEWGAILLAFVCLSFPVCCLFLIGLYLFRYRPRTRALRENASQATFKELQIQVKELRQQLLAMKR